MGIRLPGAGSLPSGRGADVSSPDLFAVLLRLMPEGSPASRAASGYQAYAIVLRLLEAVDATLAHRIHGDDAAKPLTVGPPVWRRQTAMGSSEVSIRVTALQPEVYDALARAVLEAEGRSLELGETPVRVIGLDARPHPQGLTGNATFAELAHQGDEAGDIPLAFHFLTPTTFRSGGVNATLPTADLVFGSLTRRWNAFAPFPVPDEEVPELCRLLIPVAFSLRTRQVDFGSYQQTGVVGRCRYEAPRGLPPHTYRWAATLARFATFAGIGAKTTMGMGQVRGAGRECQL